MTQLLSELTFQQALAVALGTGNAASMYMAIRGWPAAWAVVILAQSVFITYAVLTSQWLILIGGQPLCLLMGCYGLRRWLRQGVHRDPTRTPELANQAREAGVS